MQRLLISKPFPYSGQPFQVSSQKFTIFKIASQLSSQPFSGLVKLLISSRSRFMLGSCSVSARFLLGSDTRLYRDLTATLPRPYRYLYLNCRTFGANQMKTGRSNITNSQIQANRMPNKHAANYFRQCFLGFVRFRNPICSIHLRISEKSSIFAA